MLRSKNSIRLILLAPIILTFVGIYCYMNWGYLPFQNPDFGINFNEQRERLGQPPLEEYFYDKHPNWKRRKVWLTPDSLRETQLHYSKLYWTERGDITIEFDFYDPVNEVPIDTVLVRRYFYAKDSVSFELTASEQQTNLMTRQLSEFQFDSVLNAWKYKLKNYR